MKSVIAACAGLVVLLAAGGAGASEKCAPIPQARIAIQLFNFASILTPSGQGTGAAPQTIQSTFRAIRNLGFTNMERFGGTLGLTVSDYAALAKKSGLAIIGGHDQLDMAQWDRMLANARAMGQRYVGSAGFGKPGFDSLEHTLQTARNLNLLGKAAAEKGLIFYVHNHQGELATKYPYDLNKDGKLAPVSAWQIVAANTDARYVHFEVDIHWARIGIGLDRFEDLLAFLRRYSGRIVMLHVKDTSADGKITGLGEGSTDWPSVFAAAGHGIRYYIWEYDGVPNVYKAGAAAYRFLRCGG